MEIIQIDIVDAFIDTWREVGKPPTYQEVATYAYVSLATVEQRLKDAEKRGEMYRLRRGKRNTPARSWRVAKPPYPPGWWDAEY